MAATQFKINLYPSLCTNITQAYLTFIWIDNVASIHSPVWLQASIRESSDSLIKLHTGWFIESHRTKNPCLKFSSRGERRCSWLRHCVTVREVPGSIPGRDNKFQVTYSFCPHSVALECTQKFVSKVRPSSGADNPAVLLVRNVRVMMEIQNFTSPLSLQVDRVAQSV
jgi:hypothetical protein